MLLSGILIQLGIFLYIFTGGYWLVSHLSDRCARSFTQLEKLCLSSVSFCVIMSLLGVVVSIVPWNIRSLLSKSVLVLLIIPIIFYIKNKLYLEFFACKKSGLFVSCFAIIIPSAIFCLSILPVNLPSSLPDGAYVAKNDCLAVKVQYITGNLPADNSIPHVVSEFLLRDISFKNVHPILPGQEVTNRPILAALIVVPIRAALDLPPQWSGSFPEFSYAGRMWPDFSILISDDYSYMISLSVGIVLNSLFLLAIGVVAMHFKNFDILASIFYCLLILASPYFIFQIMFVWPKFMAAFFAILACYFFYYRNSKFLCGTLLGMGYLSHPYVLVVLLFFLFYVILGIYTRRDFSLTQIFFFFVITVLPWIYWSKLYLRLPSDLISQNFYIKDMGLKNFIWVRFINLFNIISPLHLTRYPFDVVNVVRESTLNILGAIGPVIGYFFSKRFFSMANIQKLNTVLIFVFFVTIFLFSNVAVPIFHGFQFILPFLLFYGVVEARKIGNKFFCLIVFIQLFFNTILIIGYFSKLLASV